MLAFHSWLVSGWARWFASSVCERAHVADTQSPEKPPSPTYQDWVRAIRERDEKQAVTKRKTRRSGY